jgi:predicted site-specific integrase-resolvase
LSHRPHNTEPAHLTLRDASRRLGVSTATLRVWVYEGLIRAERGARGALRFRPEAISSARSLLGFPELSGD